MKALWSDPAVRTTLKTWLVLLALVAGELGAALLGAGIVAPFVGIAMAAIVFAIPMELPSAPNAAKIFALAGLFWLVVMLFGLGTLDPLTRHDQPTHFLSQP